MPDFFIVGHAKCGTTALYEMLRRHPEIYMPDLKEPAYFASDVRRRFRRRAAGPLPQTLEDYLSLFQQARPEQRVGEASSLYLWSPQAPGAIAQAQPGARIIAILREPASFLRSLHLQLLQNHIETQKSLRKAISLEAARRQGRRVPRRSPQPPALQYSERVRYVEQLRRYHDAFPQEQVLVLIYDDFRRDNEGTIRQVQRFLAVDDTLPIEATEANRTVLVRSQQLDDLVHAVSVGRGPVATVAKATVKAFTPRRLHSSALRAAQRTIVHGDAPPPDEGLMLELRRRFKPEVVALSEYLDRDLVALWGYDSLD
ncbi:MAG: sulfotransferase family protein [Solirubrobacteraceae bacterium]